VRKSGYRNGTEFEELIPYHKCTEADYEGFYPPAKTSQLSFNYIREDPRKNLFCLDD